jgi:hypothetical protein
MKLELSDESGVSKVWAYFHHVGSNSYIVLEGDGGGQIEAVVELHPSTYSSYMAPGEYRCTKIEASDAAGNLSTYSPKTEPQLVNASFQYVHPGTGSSDTEGPVFKRLVSDVFATLTSPEVSTNDLKQYQTVLIDTLRSVRSVEETESIVRVEMPELASLTQEIATTRNVHIRIAFIKMILAIIGWLLVSQSVNINDVNLNLNPDVDLTIDQDPHDS